MPRLPLRSSLFAVALLIVACACSACGHAARLMNTPNLMLVEGPAAFESVPPEHRTPYVDVLFATDRFPLQEKANDPMRFGAGRSSHLRVGKCRVQLGRDMSWDDLVEASTTRRRGRRNTLSIGDPRVLLRYPGNPWRSDKIDDPSTNFEHYQKRREETRELLRETIAPYLAASEHKRVFLFVHGYNNTFDDAIRIVANYWHFLGREGVPIAYTWPAGAGGLRGYTTDRESGEFTIYHLKALLTDLAADPDVERIDILAHSRGTDVTLTALRELTLAHLGPEGDGDVAHKIGTVILASPDLAPDIVGQRITSERVPSYLKRISLYNSRGDMALRLSSWLQGSVNRLGGLDVRMVPPAQLEEIARNPAINVIDAPVTVDLIGHSYYYSNPAVSSDIILTLRDDRSPGVANGRPLTETSTNLWRIEDDYLLE